MRNKALHDQLRSFTEAAARRLTAALDAGAEISFEVVESPGSRSVLYRYRPLSEQFVRERFTELKALPAFAQTAEALSRIEGVSGYLRVMGANYVPAAERDRAEAALERFLARVWEDASTFDLEGDRFERAHRELESIVYEDTAVNTVLAPLIGVTLGEERWELGSGVALVRGDLVNAPPEAVWGSDREGEEPHTLVLLTVESRPSEPPPLTEARVAFRRLVTALRLLKPGAAALGSTAWWHTDEGPWQTVPLGSTGRVRGTRYRLAPSERPELAELFELARARHAHGGSLPWAMSRFELGCEQPVSLEGLSDHLLALRSLLDRGDSTAAEMARRLSVLCAEPDQRGPVQECVEQAFRLERLVMRGDVDAAYLETIGVSSPEIVVAELEGNLRAVLRDMVCGHLQPDLHGIAEELMRAPRQGQPATVATQTPEPEPTPEPEAPPEPDFVVRRGADADLGEQDTEEAVAVGGVREVRGDDPEKDWGLDDDAADYSGAV